MKGSKFHFVQKEDVSKVGMDLRVHQFASDVAEILPYSRTEVPMSYNGSSDKSFKPSTSSLLQRDYDQDESYPKGRKDISEKGIDENVHWFANPNTETLNWKRSEEAFVPNGSNPKAFKLHQKNDISEKGIDENVQWFANPNTETLNWKRSEEAFVPNGSNPKAFKLYQRSKNDISEKGIDEDVHDFANNQPEVPRLAYPRTTEPVLYNGSGAKAHKFSLYQEAPVASEKIRKDISEKGIDEEVHGFANPMTETLNWERTKDAFLPNGSNPKAFKLTQRQKNDISEK
jgi:hypothetical protein